jgi:capsular exopolysaccharide synthesis family protein
MVSVNGASGRQAEAIRTLRTHVMARHINQGRRALAICGPTAGVGCSFMAANLAVALSQIGVKTLLIDADLRRPSLDSLIRPAREPMGLTHCLSALDAPFSDSIAADVLPNLAMIFAGRTPANAQELLAGERFRALMNFCLREFDATIVDTPPANTSSDSRRISSVVGYSLIVASKDKTVVRDVQVLSSELKADRAVVIGSVLNRG